ncbi:MAG: glycosyltransferase family 39 protein [Candidatus Aenigmatarchaeota archaeon]
MNKINNTKERIDKELVFLIILSIFLRFIWLYAAIERDEGIFGYSAFKLSINELKIVDNKIPIVYIIYLLIMIIHKLLSFNFPVIISVRIVNNLLFLIAVVCLYRFFSEEKREIAFFSTIFFIIFMNLPVFEGQLAMTESLGMNFFVLGLIYMLRYAKHYEPAYFRISFFFFLLAALLKYPFLFLSVHTIIFFIKNRTGFKKVALFLITYFITAILMLGFYFIAFPENVLFFIIESINVLNEVPEIYSFSSLKLVLIEGFFFIILVVLGVLEYYKVEKKEKIFYLFKNMLLISLVLSLIPPSFGHYFLINSIAVAFFAGVGILSLKRFSIKLVKYIIIVILFLAIIISVYFSMLQYPNLNINFKGINVVYNDFLDLKQQLEVSKFLENHIKQNESFAMCGFDGTLGWLSERRIFSGVRKFCYIPNGKENENKVLKILKDRYLSRIIIYDVAKILSCELPDNIKYLVLFTNAYDETLFKCTGKIEMKYDNLLICKC